MPQPRHDLYTAVHKALRQRIFQSVCQLEGCDFSSAADRDAALAHVRETLDFLEEHASHEDAHVQPRVAEANPALGKRLASAHELVHQSADTVAQLVQAIAKADGETAMGRSPELCHAMNVLAAQQVEHMNDEETLANAALWQSLSDEALREIHGRLLGAIPPPRMAQWMAIMLPAINVHERIGVMGGMKATAPPQAFDSMMALGRKVVGERWEAVSAALG